MSRPKTITLIEEDYRALSQDFYEYLLRLGYHAKTSRSRYHYIKEFLHWLEQRGLLKIDEVTSEQIQLYYEYLSTRISLNAPTQNKVLNPKTIYTHMRNVRDLFTMLQNENVLSSNPCTVLHFSYPKQKSSRTILSQAQIEQLYEACETAQERAILSLSYGCGLRVSELEKCNIEDVKLREKILIVPEGKGLKRRVIPMSSGVVKDLSDYYYEEREYLTKGRNYRPGLRAFMLHSRGGRMNKWTYNQNLKKIVERMAAQTGDQSILTQQITIHHLRHSIASHLIEQGVIVEQVRLFLGHSQLETTQIYTHINQSQLKKLIEDDTTENTENESKELPP